MTQIYIISGTSWTVPGDWSNTNTIECIGAGSGGRNGGSSGGGGAYAKISNLATLTPGGSVTIGVGIGGAGGPGNTTTGTDGAAGGDTWFNGASLAVSSVGAQGGQATTSAAGGAGGAAASSVGTTKFSGASGVTGGSGAGGAAGPNGNGGTAGNGTTTLNVGGDGGGGNGGGSAGIAETGSSGGNGGAAQDATAGGLGSTASGTPGGVGSHGSGGGGGFGNGTLGTSGGNGGAGVEWDASHGSGGGGGGAGNGGSGTNKGGDGGLYGGGGAGGGFAAGGSTRNAGGAGANGIIVIIYTPAASVLSGTYYVDSSIGSDAYDGTTPTVGGGHGPWATAANIASNAFNGSASVLFNAGQTFSTNISIGVSNQGASPVWSSTTPVTFSRYGNGVNPIISVAGTTTIGFAALNIAGFGIDRLDFVGPGIATGTVDGIQIQTNRTSGARLDYVQVLNCNVSQFGANGLNLGGTGGAGGATSGFSNVMVSGGSYHDNTGASATGLCGIKVHGVYGTQNTHINVTITNVKAYNNTGATGQSNWTGSGIILSETGGTGLTDADGNACGGLIDRCVAYNNGANSSHITNGPVGIWTNDSINVVIQLCESYGNKSGSTADGGGFDLDGGTTNCTIQYCYSHDNHGPGFQVYSYSDGTVTASSGGVVRYCISQNDGASGADYPTGVMIGNDASTTGQTGVAVYNNTVYQSTASSAAVILEGTFLANVTGHVCNNILYVTSGLNFIHQATNANPTGLIFDGNDYFTTGTFSLDWNGTTYTTLASWKAAATAQEPHSGSFSTANPSLVNPGGGGTLGGYVPSGLSAYQLSFGSPMVGVGLDLNSLYSISPGTLDFYGNSVPNGRGTGFNVGAYAGLPVTAVSSDSIVGCEVSLTARSANERRRTVWWS